MDSVHHRLRHLFSEDHEMLARDSHKRKKYAWLLEECEEQFHRVLRPQRTRIATRATMMLALRANQEHINPPIPIFYERGQHPSLHQLNAKNEINQAAPTHRAANSEQAESIKAWLASCDATDPKQQARVREDITTASPATPHSQEITTHIGWHRTWSNTTITTLFIALTLELLLCLHTWTEWRDYIHA